jgi:hypothetical protein
MDFRFATSIGIPQKQPDGSLIRRPADEQVRGVGQDFIVGIGADDFERQVFV